MILLNTRFYRYAQVIAMDGMYAGFAGAKIGDQKGWACGPAFENALLSRSVYEALLFESTRTNFLYNEIKNK